MPSKIYIYPSGRVEGVNYTRRLMHSEIRKIPFESTWKLRHQVMWPDRELEYVKLPNDPHGLHYGLFVLGTLTSVVSAFVTDKEAQFRKFATLEKEQGRGYGSRLLSHLFQELADRKLTRIWCNARIDKTQFYERFGMMETPEKFERGGICYVIMERVR